MQVSNKEWLIKSAGEIKGPYTYDEVISGLNSKEFIVVDEISKKFNRWKYIRDEGTFEKVVLELKNREEVKGDKTFTNSTTDVLTEDLTDKILNFSGKDKLLTNVEEHHKKNERKSDQAKNKSEYAETVSPTKSYASERELKQKSTKINFFRMSYAIIIVCLVYVYFLYNDREKVLSYDELKRKSQWHMNYGEYTQAKLLMEKALALNKSDDELKYAYAYANFELDDYITTQRILDEFKMTMQDKRLSSLIWNLTGIVYLKNYSLSDAKHAFDKSLEASPQFTAAFYNKGVTDYLENNFELAYQNFSRSMVLGGLDGAILLSMVELNSRYANELKTDEGRQKRVLDLLALINRHIATFQIYKQELSIGAAYLQFIIGNNNEMEKLVNKALDIDPDLTSNHILDGTYYRGLVTWDRMSDWVQKMRDAHTGNENLRTLYGYAMFRGSEKLKGKDIIEGLLKSDFSNIYNQVINGYILYSLSLDEEARAALNPVLENTKLILGHLIMGQICLNKMDAECATEHFEKSRKISPNDVTALAGLAYAFEMKKNREQAQRYINQAYRLAPQYKPALELRKIFDKGLE